MAEIDVKNDFFNDESKVSVFKRIPMYDYTMTNFRAHKEWSVSSNDYNSSYNKISIHQGVIPSDQYVNSIIPYNTHKYTPHYSTNPPYTDKSILWYSLEHKYYKDYSYSYDIKEGKNQILKLYESSSFASIPRYTFGEGIKKGSVYIVDLSAWTFIELIDDKKGNLIDKNIPTSSFINKQNLMLYLGFNEVYDKRHTTIFDLSNHKRNILKYGKTILSPGINSTGIYTGSAGWAYRFDGSASLSIKDDIDWYTMDKGQDFSISFWIKLDANQDDYSVENIDSQSIFPSEYKTLLSKRKEGDIYHLDKKSKYLSKHNEDLESISFPVHIGVYNTPENFGKLFFERFDGEVYSMVDTNSTIYRSDGKFNHIVVNKTGSILQMYVNNTLVSSSIDNTKHTLINHSDWFIGSDGKNKNNIRCDLDELRIYNRALSTQEIGNLYSVDFETGSAFQTNRVGNVFYKEGMIVVSDFRRRYHRVFLGTDGDQDYSDTWNSIDIKWRLVDPTWNNLYIGEYYLKGGFLLDFKSTQTITEHEIICRLNPSEFNMSLNPSLRVDGRINTQFAKSFITGSDFTPYITTIGLYNDKYEMVAVAKLSSPIPKLNDVPLNFIVRFDS